MKKITKKKIWEMYENNSIKLISKYKPRVCALKNYNLISIEKFEPGSGFEPRTSRSLVWRSTT